MVPVSDPGTLREIARTASVEYPVPYLTAILAVLTLTSRPLSGAHAL